MSETTVRARTRTRRTLTTSATVLSLGAFLMTSASGAAMADDATASDTGKDTTAAAAAKGPEIPNAKALEDAATAASDAGVVVTKNTEKSLVADAGDDTEAKVTQAAEANDAEIAKLKEVTEEQKKLNADYAQKKAAYDAAKAAYDKTVNSQIKNADPNKAIVIDDKMAYAQPFTLTNDKASLDAANVKVTNATKVQTLNLAKGERNRLTYKDSTGATKILSGYDVPSYNSNTATTYDVKNDSTITATWKNVATDIETGRPIDATVTFNNFSTSPKHTRTYFTGNPHIDLYSNFIDNISKNGVFNVNETFSLKYADGAKEAYPKKFYVNAGSLNAQPTNKSTNPASPAPRYEYAAPGKGVISSFVNKKSLVYPVTQSVQGTAAQKTKTAFMVKQGRSQGGGIPDNQRAIEELGVSFLVNNGATVSFGVSGVNGKDPGGVSGTVEPLVNHIMTATTPIAKTVVAPVLPKPPAPLKVAYTPTVVEPNGPADLQLNKFGVSVSDDNKGTRSITYGFQVKNAGGSVAKTPVITDTFGEGLVKDSITWSGPSNTELPEGAKVSEDKTSVTLPDTAAGATQTVYATVELEKGYVAKDAVNGAKVTSPSDPTKGGTCEQPAVVSVDEDTDGCDTVTVPILPPDLKIHKEFTNDTAPAAGGDASFAVTATNAGTGNAGSVDVKDVVGAGIDPASLKITGVTIVNPGTPVNYAEKVGETTVPFSADGTVTQPPASGAPDDKGPVFNPSPNPTDPAEKGQGGSYGGSTGDQSPDPEQSESGAIGGSFSGSSGPIGGDDSGDAVTSAAAAEETPGAGETTPAPEAGTGEVKAPEYTIESSTTVHFTNLNPGAEVSIAVSAKYVSDLAPETDAQNRAMITSPDDPEKGRDNGKTNTDLVSDDDGYDAVNRKSPAAEVPPAPTPDPEPTETVTPTPDPEPTESEKPAPPAPEPTESTPADPAPEDKPDAPEETTVVKTGLAQVDDDGGLKPSPAAWILLAVLGGTGAVFGVRGLSKLRSTK